MPSYASRSEKRSDPTPIAGSIHHSDRAVQYACGEYLARKSALRSACRERLIFPTNGQRESFFKTLEYEEVDLSNMRATIMSPAVFLIYREGVQQETIAFGPWGI
jgi:hypothetical protein